MKYNDRGRLLFLAAGGPIAEVSNTSLKDFIGKTLVHIKRICFPRCGLSNVTNSELMTVSRRMHTVWRRTLWHWLCLKFVAFRIRVSWVVTSCIQFMDSCRCEGTNHLQLQGLLLLIFIFITFFLFFFFFFLFFGASALFRAMASPLARFRDSQYFYEVRKSAPRPTPNLDGQSILLLVASSSQPVQHVWPYRQLPSPC